MLYFPITDTSSTNSDALPTRRVTISATRPDVALNVKNLSTNLKDLSLELVTVDHGQNLRGRRQVFRDTQAIGQGDDWSRDEYLDPSKRSPFQ